MPEVKFSNDPRFILELKENLHLKKSFTKFIIYLYQPDGYVYRAKLFVAANTQSN